MLIFKNQQDLNAHLRQLKSAGKTIGFVPTMGALHQGHISLIKQANQHNDVSVCSVFVNPTQFNNLSDFKNYPLTVSEDIKMLERAQCAVLYLPAEADVYQQGSENAAAYNFDYLDTVLEGKQRPGHFKGVGQVVSILLDAVEPSALYVGQKDFQQCAVIRNLLQQKGLTDQVELIIVETMREDDGLAMSSRNRRLTDAQRSVAGVIYQCLVSIVTKRYLSSFTVVKKECFDLLLAKGFTPEYIEIADTTTLEILNDYDNEREMVVLIAAKLGSVRLIDNMLIR